MTLEEQREKVHRERMLQVRQRWLEKKRLEEQWMEEHPALKAWFYYLQTMLQREVLSFYDPSCKECGHMSDCRNRTDGEWMRTLPAYDLEQVAAFYRDLWDARDHLTAEELEHAPDRLRGVLSDLTHRRLYLRLNCRYQLTALGDRRENLLERFRKQDVHLILQPSPNEIVDLTNGAVYDLHVEEMGRSPLTDDIVGGEVTLVPAERTDGSPKRESGMDRRRVALNAELRYGDMLDLIGIDEDAEQRFRQMLARTRTLAPENLALIARLERVKEFFPAGFSVPCGILPVSRGAMRTGQTAAFRSAVPLRRMPIWIRSLISGWISGLRRRSCRRKSAMIVRRSGIPTSFLRMTDNWRAVQAGQRLCCGAVRSPGFL